MEYTNKALDLMEKEKWYEAQTVLREAVEKEPCCESYNNLGVFYIDNGIQYKKGDSKEAADLGYKYLKMAEYCDLNYKNLIALAEYNYHYGNVDDSCKLYKKASELDRNYLVYNNLACGCYKLGGYIKAAMYFDKALKIAHKNIDDIKISCCYALLKCQEDYTHILDTISNEGWTVLDRFILYYFNGDIEKAYEFTDSIIAEWEFNLPVLAMLYECLEQNNVAKLNKFDSEILKLVSNNERRKEIIKDYNYMPVMLWQCKYIGCDRH